MRIVLAAALAWLALAGPSAGADYPSKPVRLIVPFAAGSATDSLARIVAHELTQRLGQPVVVDNRAGAFGQIAAGLVARSAADGYMLFLTTNTTHSANPHLFKSLDYDPIADFAPIVRTGTLPFMLVVNPQVPVRTTAQLIDYAKAHPGKLFYASANSTSLVCAETLNRMAGISITGVQYKASPQAILDLMAGRIQVMVSDFATAMPQVRAGKLRVLAVTTARRSALVPQAPPIADAVPGFDVTSWNGIFAPAGTPAPVLERLARELTALLQQARVRARLAELGFEVDALGPEPFARYVKEQADYWGRLVRAAGIPPQ
jgi:tripartite-type tricarboxylate transporter receptor subunit TctC